MNTDGVTEEVVWALWQGLPERVIKRTTRRTVVMVTEEWKPARPMGKVFASFEEARDYALKQATENIDYIHRTIRELEKNIRSREAEQAALEQMTEPED